jgi:hypothetical protein
MTLSLEADATTPFDGCQSQVFTSPPCPLSVASSVAVLKSQICGYHRIHPPKEAVLQRYRLCKLSLLKGEMVFACGQACEEQGPFRSLVQGVSLHLKDWEQQERGSLVRSDGQFLHGQILSRHRSQEHSDS